MIKPAGKYSIDVGRVDPPPEYTMMTDMDVRTSYRVGGEPNNSGDVREAVRISILQSGRLL
jgi:hypothetical protein